jgi:putative hydrolase of the HAD superfamily
MSRITAVVFDLDDTLYLEREYAFSGFGAVAAAFEAELGDRETSAARMRELFDSDDRPRVFDTLLRERGRPVDPQVVRRMVDLYREHAPAIHLCPDADAVLTRLQGRFKLGLITDGPPRTQWAKIDALSLRHRFDAIIVTSELNRQPAHDLETVDVTDQQPSSAAEFPPYGKPHPLTFELMAERLRADPPQCVYVADNPAKDFIAPNVLGWLTFQIQREGGIYGHERAGSRGEPAQVVHNLADLDALLESRGAT